MGETLTELTGIGVSATSPETRRPTLLDVANACGLSRATVARALSGKGYVDQEKRSLIQKTAKRMGYQASGIARALRTQRSASVGVLVADITNPIFPLIVKGVDDVVSQSGNTILLSNTDEDPGKQRAAIRSLLERQVDGLILISQSIDAECERLLRSGPPCVFVNRHPEAWPVDYVGPDNSMSVGFLVNHLYERGHRRIAYVIGPISSSTARERHEHFQASMAEKNLTVPPEYVFQGNYLPSVGRTAAKQFLALDERPTAIVASNDFVALGVIEHAQSVGLTVPRDLSVTGFDDVFSFDETHPYPLPMQGLTTVEQPKRKLGEEAGKMLIGRIAGDTSLPRQLILPTSLKVRGTTASVGKPFE